MRSWILFVVLGVALLTGVLVSTVNADEPEPYTIMWGGDTFLGDRGLPLLTSEGYDAAFRQLPSLAAADLTSSTPRRH